MSVKKNCKIAVVLVVERAMLATSFHAHRAMHAVEWHVPPANIADPSVGVFALPVMLVLVVVAKYVLEAMSSNPRIIISDALVQDLV